MFASRSPRTGVALVVVVDGERVSLAVVKGDEHPSVVLSGSGALSPEKRSLPQIAAALKQLLSDKGAQLLKAYADKGGPKIRRVLLVLDAPLSRSFPIRSSKRFDTPERVDDALLDALARSALGDVAKQKDFLSASLLHVLLNGYTTTKAEGQHAQDIELIGFAATAEESFKDSFSGALKALLPAASIVMRPGSLSLVGAVRGAIGAGADDSLIARLSNEGTELIAMHEGIPSTCAFIPVGLRHIAERIAPGKPVLSTLSSLRLAAEGDLSEISSAKEEGSLVHAESDLAHDFGEPLSKLSLEERLPPRILLAAPAEVAEWFAHFLGRIDFAPFSMTAQPFSVELVSPQLICPQLHDTGLDIGLRMAVELLLKEQEA